MNHGRFTLAGAENTGIPTSKLSLYGSLDRALLSWAVVAPFSPQVKKFAYTVL
jgi:hypothetical protein